LKRAVKITVFYPSRYRADMTQTFGGRLSEFDMDSRMREELNLRSVLPSIIDDDNIERDTIGNTLFPESELDVLCSQFMKGWGNAILEVLGNLLPYRAHSEALEQLERQWLTDDAISSLARDSIYIGVGMYWTLRDSENYYKQQEERSRIEHLSIPTKPDIVKAWETIDSKSKEFEVLRSNRYCQKTSSAEVKNTNRAFDIMNTNACQLGTFLTITALAHRVNAKMEQVVEISKQLVQAWNISLSFKVKESRRRLLILDRDQNKSINRIPRLDPSLSIYFRYFWLELLSTPEALESLSDETLKEPILQLRSSARKGYLDFLVREQIKSLKRSNPGLSLSKIEKKAREIETSELRQSLKFWALEKDSDFDTWLQNLNNIPSDIEGNDDQEDIDGRNSSLSEELEEVNEDSSLEDLINSIQEDD
jgi:hypothetical protein